MQYLTAAQMRAIEQEAISSGGVSGRDLMERAGRGVVSAIFEEWPNLETLPGRATLLCGPGNNGGDGFVVARLLLERGWQLSVFFYGAADRLPGDARANYDRLRNLAGPERIAEIGAFSEHHSQDGAIVVDALFGTGLTRPLATDLAAQMREARRAQNGHSVKWVAVDIPSGLCSDSGRILDIAGAPGPESGSVIPADLTVTFHSPKRGHVLASGPRICGALRVTDIGLQREAEPFEREPEVVLREAMPDLRGLAKSRDAHKYHHGHAVVFSGPMGRSGAARLAARAALRVGAGLVTVAAPGSAMMECACQLTAVMLRKCNDAKALSMLLEDARLNALCLGPGIGLGAGTREAVMVALDGSGATSRRVVLDADALSSFEDEPDTFFDKIHDGCVLTPHAGEFARLFPDLAAAISSPPARGPALSKVDVAREAAARAGCAIVFKGPDTVIAAPDGRCALSAATYGRAVPWLATAGSGDVLAGLITGLLARGVDTVRAAETAVWLHTEAARAFGPGLIAEDLPEIMPSVLSDALTACDHPHRPGP